MSNEKKGTGGKAANPNSLQIYLLEQAFFHDEEVRKFLVDCRKLISLMYFDRKDVDSSLLEKLSHYLDKQFVGGYVTKYQALLNKREDKDHSESELFKTRRLRVFRQAFLRTFNIAIRKKDFRFDPMEVVNLFGRYSVMDKLGVVNMWGYPLVVPTFWDALVPKIDADNKDNKVLTEFNKKVSRLRRKIKKEVSALPGYKSGFTLYTEDASKVLLFLCFLVLADAISAADVRFYMFVHIVASWLAAHVIYSAKRLWNEDALRTADSLDVIDRVKRTTFKPEETYNPSAPCLDIAYQDVPTAVRELSADKRQQPLASEVSDSEEEIKPRRPKRRHGGGQSADESESKGATVTPVVETLGFSQVIGHLGKYGPISLKPSDVYSIRKARKKHFYACIDPNLLSELQATNPPAAKKFGDAVLKPKSLSSKSWDEEGVKYLVDEVVELGDEIVAIYELKVVGEFGNARMLGYSKRFEESDTSYEVVCFVHFAEKAHPKVNLDKAITELNNKVQKAMAGELLDAASIQPQPKSR